jgi:hypothetical protein
MVGSVPDLLFDTSCPYAGCRLCGAVFQSDDDRAVGDVAHNYSAMMQRKNWSQNHAKKHTDKEHLLLAYSGRWCTPEAAYRFASYGIIALSDMVMSDEHEGALRESKAIPINDVEGRV